MTDRINALTVVLEDDIRIDDIEALVKAIHLLRGVLNVETHVVDVGAHIAKERAKAFYRSKLHALLWEG